MSYQEKYLKYKNKYLSLKKLVGGAAPDPFLLTKPGSGQEVPPDVMKEIFKKLNIKDLLKLYLTGNKGIIDDIEDTKFDFYDEPIPEKMSLKQFRNIFKSAIGINIEGRQDITDADFQFIRPLLPDTENIMKGFRLNMRNCNQITYAAFVHLKGIHTLNMARCDRITDAAFEHLKGIKVLDMSECDKITDAAFVHLKGINRLNMTYCKQITDAAFVHLEGIHTLNMTMCDKITITDAAFVHLKGIHTLNMSWCGQITNAAFVHIKGIKYLDMSNIFVTTITIEGLRNLVGIEEIRMYYCKPQLIRSAEELGLPVIS